MEIPYLLLVNMSVEDALKTAKIQRRSSKAGLTQLGKALVVLQDQKRTANEVSYIQKQASKA